MEKIKKKIFIILLAAFLILGIRSCIIFQSESYLSDRTHNFSLNRKLAITDEAPFHYEDHLIYPLWTYRFTKHHPLEKSIYIFSDFYSRGAFNRTLDSFPYLLFRKMNNENFLTSLTTISPPEMTLENLPDAINTYASNADKKEQGIALVMLGFYDLVLKSIDARELIIKEWPKLTENFSLTVTNQAVIKSYFSWLFFFNTPRWPEILPPKENAAEDLYQVWSDYLDTYSAQTRQFSISKKQIIDRILSKASIVGPFATFWKKELDNNKDDQLQILNLLTVFLTVHAIQTNNRTQAINALLRLAKINPDFFVESDNLRISVLCLSQSLPKQEKISFLTNLNVQMNRSQKTSSIPGFMNYIKNSEKVIEEINKLQYAKLIQSITLLKQKNFVPVIMTYPFETSFFPNHLIRQFAAESQTPLIDLAFILKQRVPDLSQMMTHNYYLSPKGHHVVSEIIFETIKPQ